MAPEIHRWLSLGVLYFHLLAMAITLGGSGLLWWLALPGADDALKRPFLSAIARRYEWSFWAAVGVGVMTGVGNLGVRGSNLPPASSAWGAALTIKLALVIAGALLSLVRTLIVLRAECVAPDIIRRAYGATALGVATIAAVGVFLADG